MKEYDHTSALIMAEGDVPGPDSPYVSEVEAYLHRQACERQRERICGGQDVHLLLILPRPMVTIKMDGRFDYFEAVIVTEHGDGRVTMWRCSSVVSACRLWEQWQ